MINTVALQGNLTRDAEIRYTQTGFAVGKFTVAVNDRRKNSQTGQWEDDPSFIDVKLLGPRAEKLAPYLTKGKRVTVQGKLKQERWEDRKSGQARSYLYVLVDELEFASSRNSGAEASPAPAAPAGAVGDAGLAYDDIPF